jgi:hypothetical protein
MKLNGKWSSKSHPFENKNCSLTGIPQQEKKLI